MNQEALKQNEKSSSSKVEDANDEGQLSGPNPLGSFLKDLEKKSNKSEEKESNILRKSKEVEVDENAEEKKEESDDNIENEVQMKKLGEQEEDLRSSNNESLKQEEIQNKLEKQKEEELALYLKLNYYFENSKIQHAKKSQRKNIEKVNMNEPDEVSIVDKMKELDKPKIERSKCFFFHGVLLQPHKTEKKRKRLQLSLQNMSVKPNDIKILGNQKHQK